MNDKKTPQVQKHKEGMNDIIAGIVLGAFALWYFISATKIQIPNSLSTSRLSAASVPELWGGVLALVGVLILIRGIRKVLAAKKEGYVSDGVSFGEKMKNWFTGSSAAIAMFAVLFLYVLLMNTLGFMIDTVLFLFCEFLILTRKEERNIVMSAILAVVFGIGIYMLFKYGFKMPLPQGFFKLF